MPSTRLLLKARNQDRRVDQVEGAWLPDGAWADCVDLRPIPDGTAVVLGLDGSFSQDCTALVAVTLVAGEPPGVGGATS